MDLCGWTQVQQAIDLRAFGLPFVRLLADRAYKANPEPLRTEPVILAGKEVDGLSHRVPVFGVGWREPQGRGT